MSRFLGPNAPAQAVASPHTTLTWNQPRSRVILPPTVIRSGPVFALIVPVTHHVTTQPPDPGFHPPTAHGDPAAATGEFLLIFIVLTIATWTFICRVIPLYEGEREQFHIELRAGLR